MAYPYARFNVEVDGNVLTAANYNGEHDNHITNNAPSSINDYMSNSTEARSQTDPGTYASPSLATSLAGDIERLRKRLADIIGGSNASWLDAPATSLGILSQPSGGLHIGLEFDGMNGGASSTTDVLARFVNLGGIINALTLISADVVAANFGNTNVKFGSHSYLASGNVLAFPGNHGNPVKGSVSAWFRNLNAGDYIAYNPLLGIELYCESGAGKLTASLTEKIAATESTKTVNTVQGASTRSADTTFRNAILRWRANDEGGASTDLLELLYGGGAEGTQLTGQDLDINGGDGGVWFFGAKRNDPTWDHFLANSGLPTAHSDPWTSNGTPNAAVSNGVLNIATTGANLGSFSKTNNIDLSQMTVEWKMKINTISVRSGISPTHCVVSVRDDSMNRRIDVRFSDGSVAIGDTDGATGEVGSEVWLNTKQWHTYRLTSSGSPSPAVNLYIDGVFVAQFTATTVDATAGDSILFGDNSSTANRNVDVDYEYFKYFDAGAEPPIAADSAGQMDSIGVTSSIIDAATVITLQSSAVTSVFNTQPKYGPSLPLIGILNRTGSLSSISSTFEDVGNSVYYVAGDGISEYMFHFQASVTTDTPGADAFFSIDVDNDISSVGIAVFALYGGGQSDLTSTTDRRSVGTTRAIVLSPGLHEVRPQYLTSAGTLSISPEEGMIFECWLRRIG